MATKVLDSWALLAFFEDEPAAEVVEKLLQQAADETHKLLLSVVNWGEVYYTTMRRLSQAAAEQKAQEIAALPIEIVGVSDDLALTRQAAIYKATPPPCPSRRTPSSSPATRSSRRSRRTSRSTG
jgi:ribonuclease VapC